MVSRRGIRCGGQVCRCSSARWHAKQKFAQQFHSSHERRPDIGTPFVFLRVIEAIPNSVGCRCAPTPRSPINLFDSPTPRANRIGFTSNECLFSSPCGRQAHCNADLCVGAHIPGSSLLQFPTEPAGPELQTLRWRAPRPGPARPQRKRLLPFGSPVCTRARRGLQAPNGWPKRLQSCPSRHISLPGSLARTHSALIVQAPFHLPLPLYQTGDPNERQPARHNRL